MSLSARQLRSTACQTGSGNKSTDKENWIEKFLERGEPSFRGFVSTGASARRSAMNLRRRSGTAGSRTSRTVKPTEINAPGACTVGLTQETEEPCTADTHIRFAPPASQTAPPSSRRACSCSPRRCSPRRRRPKASRTQPPRSMHARAPRAATPTACRAHSAPRRARSRRASSPSTRSRIRGPPRRSASIRACFRPACSCLRACARRKAKRHPRAAPARARSSPPMDSSSPRTMSSPTPMRSRSCSRMDAPRTHASSASTPAPTSPCSRPMRRGLFPRASATARCSTSATGSSRSARPSDSSRP